MKQKVALYIIVSFLAGMVFVYFITSISYFQNNFSFGGMMGRGGYSGTNIVDSNRIDEHFIEEMIPHHEDAILISEIALSRAKKEEVRTLAQNIITNQAKEIKDMKNWYKEWFGREYVDDGDDDGYGDMHMGMMQEESDIEYLKNAENFDQEYLKEMIPHHIMAVMMANMLKNGTERSEMKELADNIISSQTKEINQMRKWYIQWGYSE